MDLPRPPCRARRACWAAFARPAVPRRRCRLGRLDAQNAI